MNTTTHSPDCTVLPVRPRLRPPLEESFLPAALWNRAYRKLVEADPAARAVSLALIGSEGTAARFDCRVLGAAHPASNLTFPYLERLLKFLLWQKGGAEVWVAGADEEAARLARVYAPGGERAFDSAFLGGSVFGRPFRVKSVAARQLPEARTEQRMIGRHLDGCRIGFDLGGSDRKVAALIDGRVVFSEEVAWDPYFQSDPAYHLAGVADSLRRAAAHLPRVDAIGGSAAGIYLDNEVRVASLFRGVSGEQFERHIRRMFCALQQRWGGVPVAVANDGEVTALAGAAAYGENALLGLSLGTSLAAGYVTPEGGITTWLNELAFAPVDYHPDAPRDEWSGDAGCGVQYFSQQAVDRLAGRAGFTFPSSLPQAARLAEVQRALARGDDRARAVYESLGTSMGYALGHYADFFELRSVLILGRVTSGGGGGIIIERAEAVLRAEFPELAERVRLRLPDETAKRHGQAIAAAGLPALAGVPDSEPAHAGRPGEVRRSKERARPFRRAAMGRGIWPARARAHP